MNNPILVDAAAMKKMDDLFDAVSPSDLAALRVGDTVWLSEFLSFDPETELKLFKMEMLFVKITQRDGDMFHGQLKPDGGPIVFHSCNISGKVPAGHDYTR
jgi:hypothetical protein